LHSDAAGVAIVLSNYGVMLCRFGEFQQAEETLRSALIAFEKHDDKSSKQYGVTLANLGDVLGAKNDWEAAATFYDGSIEILEKLGAPARIELASALAGRGALYERLGSPDQARQSEERALDLLPPTGNAPLRAQILRNLGNIVADGRQPADSMPYFEQSLVIHEKTLGSEDPTTAALLLDYASATQRAGNKSLSRKLRKRAQDLLARLRSQSLTQMTVSLRDLRENK
jgi:tetratricopeptide (TPR) repeat protein